MSDSDVLHPNRPNVSKDELRSKLSELYKANKDQVSAFGFRTQYGGGKSTGFALIYDSGEAMKKFEPHYRLVRYGQATKVERASRQQRTYTLVDLAWLPIARDTEVLHLAMERTGWLTISRLQASNARTAPRPSGVLRRTRRWPRRSKVVLSGGMAVLWIACIECHGGCTGQAFFIL